MKDPKAPRPHLHGRGSAIVKGSRFDSTQVEPEYDYLEYEEEWPLPRTHFYKDASKTVVTENNSPDIGFRFSINPYRGCEHGCAYCYARPTHEYLGFSAGLDFESKIMVKEDAPELLRQKLLSPKWVPESIAMSGVTDCYQPAERRYQLTRRCLQVLAEFRNPVFIITKNRLITRDLDVLQELASFNAVGVFLSITTLDADLCGVLEPRTSRPSSRLKAIEELAKLGVPVGVNVAPVIPGLTDHEMPAILKAAKEAGASQAGYTPLRLPLAVGPIFTDWLEMHRPHHKEKVLGRIRDLRGGKINDSEFGSRMRGVGQWSEHFRQMFKLFSQKEGLNQKNWNLSADHFTRHGDQLEFSF